MWRRTDAYAYAYADSYTYAYPHTYAYAHSYFTGLLFERHKCSNISGNRKYKLLCVRW
jgi:hypothetical protein